MAAQFKCAKAPCKSCPYRQDVPSGLWAQEEYDKLPKYDGEMVEQLSQGGAALFLCHQHDGNLCAGWVAAHEGQLVALRLLAADIAPSVWGYESPVPVFRSGREAAEHGRLDIARPGIKAAKAISRLMTKQAARQ